MIGCRTVQCFSPSTDVAKLNNKIRAAIQKCPSTRIHSDTIFQNKSAFYQNYVSRPRVMRVLFRIGNSDLTKVPKKINCKLRQLNFRFIHQEGHLLAINFTAFFKSFLKDRTRQT